MHYHRRHFRDPRVIPPGKALEMVTIDAARALGMESDIGSLDVGKKADVILVETMGLNRASGSARDHLLVDEVDIEADADAIHIGKILVNGVIEP